MPETAAGRPQTTAGENAWKVIREYDDGKGGMPPIRSGDVLAIEAEAHALGRAEALAAVRAAVEGLFGTFHPMVAVENEPTDHQVVSRKAVLAAIDKVEVPHA